MGFCPDSQSGIFGSDNRFQLLPSFLIESSRLREDGERVLRISSQVGDCLIEVGTGGTQRLTVCGYLTFERTTVCGQCSFAHHCITDDQRRFLFFSFCFGECFTDLIHVVAINVDHLPVPGPVFCGHIFTGHFIGGG